MTELLDWLNSCSDNEFFKPVHDDGFGGIENWWLIRDSDADKVCYQLNKILEGFKEASSEEYK